MFHVIGLVFCWLLALMFFAYGLMALFAAGMASRVVEPHEKRSAYVCLFLGLAVAGALIWG